MFDNVDTELLKGQIVSNLFHLLVQNRELSMAEMITAIEKIVAALDKIIEIKIHTKVAQGSITK